MELTLPQLQAQLKVWKGCPLAEHSNPVLGEGNPNADIMFIGEAPGQKEDELGRPFVGAAGQFLNELLASIDLQREDVYISNVVKYRPPNNRDPTDEEKAQCMPWVKLEIAIIQPKVIVPLGRHALGHFFTKISITNAHGNPQTLRQARLPDGQAPASAKATAGRQGDTPDITIFPLYHPAAALHNGNLRQTLLDDFQKLKEFLTSKQ
ncbi:uracil-DNA glycosylase [Candidatus Peregrinibacteria bacterium CG22_combo_CG10-13_8_21_14_all_49_11]|nr:MAG: uracil-DNA glycosylase [Candidatus Peregrinibacteria bacterium CG22_combo_CG10-13_8_21_14_all_49_11]